MTSVYDFCVGKNAGRSEFALLVSKDVSYECKIVHASDRRRERTYALIW